ncbi:hypothetical protein GJV85_02615 [Sulfurimonas aquatica]|uniref:Uncharacterized protein n=1 Tax=Sulfurimonas aquatica TaxID=2672570 RepID=A0A975AYQ6_9BACT|nr:hypothetical protein [Sulfurimonas aquatica]QSZ41052.1 hypothetical protein GJV85_02615 [Sulfurimonas aquatica]
MKKIGIGIDYSNICKDYNTSYLDRDNTDPATKKCMKQILTWSNEFLSDFMKSFEYKIYHLHSSTTVKIDEVASKRFLFYSLEKEITLQSYVLQKEYVEYDSLVSWQENNNEGILISNDEDGEGIFLYLAENSKEYQWIVSKLNDLSLEEVPFPTK